MGGTADCHVFGELMVAAAPGGGFEILARTDQGTVALAAIEIEESDFPALVIRRFEPCGRAPAGNPATATKRVVLHRRIGPHRNCFELAVSPCGDGLEIDLTGDCHSPRGKLTYQLFRWRAKAVISASRELVIHGPFLADDPGS